MNRKLIHIRSQKEVIACSHCMVKAIASFRGGAARFVEWVDLPCTHPTTVCATPHVEGHCDHDHKPSSTDAISTPRFDKLPADRDTAVAIYRHFDQEFKTLDVTRVFGHKAGAVMKMMRHHGLVKFRNCGSNTHYIHWF